VMTPAGFDKLLKLTCPCCGRPFSWCERLSGSLRLATDTPAEEAAYYLSAAAEEDPSRRIAAVQLWGAYRRAQEARR
jgi:hypothetical protein